MALFKIEKGKSSDLAIKRPHAIEGYCYFTVDDGKFYIDIKGTADSYTPAVVGENRILINAKIADYSARTLADVNGDQIDTTYLKVDDYSGIVAHTTEEWQQTYNTYVTKSKEIIVYTDYSSIDGKPIAGIKMGDGTTCAVDLPFITDRIEQMITDHINNTDIHVTPEEKTFWNNKVRCYYGTADDGTLVFTTK